MDDFARPYANFSRQETFVDPLGGPSRKVSYSVNPAAPNTHLVIEKPSPTPATNGQTINSASTLVEGDEHRLPSAPVSRSDSFETPTVTISLPQPAHLARNETLVAQSSALGVDEWLQRSTSAVSFASLINSASFASDTPGDFPLTTTAPISTDHEMVETDILGTENDALAAATIARQRSAALLHAGFMQPEAAHLLPPRRPAAEHAAILVRSLQERATENMGGVSGIAATTTGEQHQLQVPSPTSGSPVTAPEPLPATTTLDTTQLRQQAHHTLAEILNRWHIQRLACVQSVHAFVLANPKVAYEVFQHDEARNVLRLFEWDLDAGVQQTIASTYDRLARQASTPAADVGQQADASSLLQHLSLCVSEKLSFVRQLVQYTTSGEPHYQSALKESPVGYYLLPLLFDTVQGIPEVACKILLQAGRFSDVSGDALGTSGGDDIPEQVQQHWLGRLRNEMWEERRRVAAAVAAAQQLQQQQHQQQQQQQQQQQARQQVGLGLGVDSLLQVPEAQHHGDQHYHHGRGGVQGIPRSASLLAAHAAGLGSPPSVFVDPKILFPDGNDNNDGPSPFRVFRTPNATVPPTPLLGLPFPSVSDPMPAAFNGYLQPGGFGSSLSDAPMSPAGFYDRDDDPPSTDPAADLMQWETYEAPSRCLTPPLLEHGIQQQQQHRQHQQQQYNVPLSSPSGPRSHLAIEPIVADTGRRTMNSLSSATILRFAVPTGFEQASNLVPLPKKVKKKKPRVEGGPSRPLTKPGLVDVEGGGGAGPVSPAKPNMDMFVGSVPPASPERAYSMDVDSALMMAGSSNGAVPGYTVEEFSEAESGSMADDRDDSDFDESGEDMDSAFAGDGEYTEHGSTSRSQSKPKKKKVKKSSSLMGGVAVVPVQEKPKVVKPPKPPSSTSSAPKAPKKCEWCNVNHSPEWRKGPTGEKTLCNACGLKFARSKKSVAHYREFYAASNPPPFAGPGTPTGTGSEAGAETAGTIVPEPLPAPAPASVPAAFSPASALAPAPEE